ncbi:MAG: 1,4-dihydroxy-2-naphthoate polyprenyltransferase [Bernardetiaceae bacterium]|nr:1,4-dihydroxy-2-naphthoate polyprenyltransferase [Bernardetiaceae bacterium]
MENLAASSPASAWLSALRLRTLPLALASILLGSFLAAASGQFQWAVLGLAALTTGLLQILSNLANDYGDSVHGADLVKERQGPRRAVQSGTISPGAMLRAMWLVGFLALAAGVALLWVAARHQPQVFWFFLALGLVAIAAAVTYTAGARPYGYAGLGDISVLLFFGLVGVLGTFFLHGGTLAWPLGLPAAACGLLAVGVLNINNIRDIDSDRVAGKRSVPVRLGRDRAVTYHWALLLGSQLCAVGYVLGQPMAAWPWLFVLSWPLLLRNGLAVSRLRASPLIDAHLKQMALATLLFVLTFGLGQWLGRA